jgi:excisionase family DNA binding protein
VTRQQTKPLQIGFGLEELRTIVGDHLFTTVPKVAQLLDLDERSVRRGIQRGELPGIQIGSTIRIPVAELLRLAGLEEDREV